MASLLILAHGDTWDRRYQITALAASCCAAGDSVDLALFFGALDCWARDRWDELDPAPPLLARSIDEAGFPPLSSLLLEPREQGRLRLLACSASTRLLGLEAAEVQQRVDVLCGWSTFSRMITEEGRKVVTF